MNYLSAKNQNKLVRVVKLLDLIVKTGKDAINKFTEESYKIEIFVYLNYLERFTYGLESINLLLIHYPKNPNVETSIGLIIRTSLLDFMTVTYLVSYQADIKSEIDTEGGEKYDKQFNAFLSDQMYNTIMYLKLVRDMFVITQNDYKEAITNLQLTYKSLFTDEHVDLINPENKLISKKFASPKELFKRIHNSPLTQKFSKIYDLYTYYSKYEHFGLMTHYMQRRGEDNNFETIIDSLKYLIKGIGFSFAYLSHPNDVLKNEKDKLQEYEDLFNKI